MLNTEKNNINNLLNDDGFIAWVASGQKINNEYWTNIEAELNSSEKSEFNKAVIILKKLRALHIDDEKSIKSEVFIKEQYEKLITDYNTVSTKKSKVIKFNPWMKYAALLVVFLSITGLVFFFNIANNTFEANLAEASFNTTDLLIQTPDKNYYKISDDENKSWINEDGVLITVSNQAISFLPTSTAKSTKNLEYKIFVPKEKKYHLTLIDSTSVELNSNTTIGFTNSLSTKQREINLVGEAFFEVAHDKNRPFVVYSSDLKIEVLGTEFNVSNYKNNEYTSTTLIAGSINVSNQQGEHLIIKPGNKATLLHNQGDIMVEKVNVQQEVSWTNNRMIFENETLENIIKRLKKWYDVEFILTDENIRQYKFTGTLKKENELTHFLQMLKYTKGINYEIKEGNVSLFFE
ncbi:hypothetical protein APS56_00955 [Pseudalgibacter alginicilyticus]|uniref:Anti-sigma factor n=1 Tax=Pseudalgibacter alginicilyticus TaxID=1736674 RepID=A0A0P0CHM9_9FLAO|nr:FecR family protein [Pseudalgibacter alginicilyticus]ALJ03805.1 hypothetical protein APS56_00955 [Pseudalgibacter alginicilyticus]